MKHQLLLFFLASAALVFSSGARAQDAPGFQTFAYGDLEITALLDQTGRMGPDLLFGRSKEELNADLAASGLSGAFPSWINAFLVKKGEELCLIDAGTGSAEAVLNNLAASGARAEDVKCVLLTHFHMDHVGGLLNARGALAFPNAKVYASAEEDNYFLPKSGAPPQGGAGLPPLFRPYQEKGSYVTFSPGGALLPGVETVPLFGHTPGHTGYVFGSSAGPVLFFGDIVHVYLVQFPHPEVTISYDVSRPAAKDTREALFPKLAENQWLVSGAHLPFPGIGKISRDGEGYKWTPFTQE